MLKKQKQLCESFGKAPIVVKNMTGVDVVSRAARPGKDFIITKNNNK